MLFVKNVPAMERVVRGPSGDWAIGGDVDLVWSDHGWLGCRRDRPDRRLDGSARLVPDVCRCRPEVMLNQNLIVAAQSGDLVALDQLLGACQTDARRYARRHCAASDVDDAVQEALLILSRKVRQLAAPAAFSGWLFTIVRRECQRLLRKAAGRQLSLEEQADAQPATRTDESLRLDLLRAFESLPAHYLEVVLLRDFAELTIAEIAKLLNQQVPGVKSRLHRARELVREYLTVSGI